MHANPRLQELAKAHDIIRVVELNAPAPDFELRDTDDQPHRLSNYRGQLVIVNFWSCECPHSERADRSLLEMISRWNAQLALLSIACNRGEAPEAIKAVSKSRGVPLVLLDPDLAVADLYRAMTTPHVFLVDRSGFLRYRGAIDDVTFGRRQPTRLYLQEAIEALLRGHLPSLAETPAYGCAIVREALE
jgi:peroxiredoxin